MAVRICKSRRVSVSAGAEEFEEEGSGRSCDESGGWISMPGMMGSEDVEGEEDGGAQQSSVSVSRYRSSMFTMS